MMSNSMIPLIIGSLVGTIIGMIVVLIIDNKERDDRDNGKVHTEVEDKDDNIDIHAW